MRCGHEIELDSINIGYTTTVFAALGRDLHEICRTARCFSSSNDVARLTSDLESGSTP